MVNGEFAGAMENLGSSNCKERSSELDDTVEIHEGQKEDNTVDPILDKVTTRYSDRLPFPLLINIRSRRINIRPKSGQ